MKFKDIIELKKTLDGVPNQQTIVSGTLLVELIDGDIQCTPVDESEFPKKGVFALIERLMTFTGVTREQANGIADDIAKAFVNRTYLQNTMTNVESGKTVQYATRNGHKYTKYEEDKYFMYELVDYKEQDIEQGHQFGHYKEGDKLYSGYWTNKMGLEQFTQKEPEKAKSKQLSIFDFE